MLAIKNLERYALGLGENGSPNFCISKSSPSFPLVYESMPVKIDHNPEGIGITTPEIASDVRTGNVEGRAIQVPEVRRGNSTNSHRASPRFPTPS